MTHSLTSSSKYNYCPFSVLLHTIHQVGSGPVQLAHTGLQRPQELDGWSKQVSLGHCQTHVKSFQFKMLETLKSQQFTHEPESNSQSSHAEEHQSHVKLSLFTKNPSGHPFTPLPTHVPFIRLTIGVSPSSSQDKQKLGISEHVLHPEVHPVPTHWLLDMEVPTGHAGRHDPEEKYYPVLQVRHSPQLNPQQVWQEGWQGQQAFSSLRRKKEAGQEPRHVQSNKKGVSEGLAQPVQLFASPAHSEQLGSQLFIYPIN